MAILVAAVVLLLLALVVLMAERPPYYPTTGMGPMTGMGGDGTQMQGRGTHYPGGGCLIILAVIGMSAIILGLFYLTGAI